MKTKECKRCGLVRDLSNLQENVWKCIQNFHNYVCQECFNKRAKEYKQKNKAKIKKQNEEYRQKNKAKIKKRYQKYRQENKEKIKKRYKEYRQKNKEKIKEKVNKYLKNRRMTDINFKIRCNLRTRVWEAVKNNYKHAKTLELLGCSIEFLKQYLESKFKPGMTWENYGDWHIDHIKPCVSYNLADPEQQRECFHYTNLQPLWAHENLKKGARISLAVTPE